MGEKERLCYNVASNTLHLRRGGTRKKSTKKYFKELDIAYIILNFIMLIIGISTILMICVVSYSIFITFSSNELLVVIGLLFLYYISTSFWTKREFTLENGNWIERFLVKKAGASIDFIPLVTYKTIIGVAIVSIAPSLTNIDSLIMAFSQMIAGLLVLPLIKYRFIFDKMGHFDVGYTVDPVTKKISIKWMFFINMLLVGVSGFAYFGILSLTLKRSYEPIFETIFILFHLS